LGIFAEELVLRQKVAERYCQLLAEAGIAVPFVEAFNTSAWAQFTVQVSARDKVQEQLKALGVPTAVHYPIPLNRQPAVKDDSVALPVGDAAASRVMSLPMHPYLDEAVLRSIVQALSDSLGQ
jgi:UDP-2-acetamido-2-deoxy-ribo-hexuluronate aminotransferase